jgi:2',3'-cyclic-nucleotide 2'-phosphodiesterase (5'-nucleotidase family)
MLNGGGIRSDLPKGEVTFNDLLSVFPFNNTACIATLTGQQLLDVLEFSVSILPYEDGSFMQVSGLKFSVDSSIPSAVVMDEKDLFLHVKEGKRRVNDLQIWDKKNKTYQPVDLERRYSLASFSYQLKELGSSGIFRYTELKEDNLGQDVEVLASYIEQILGGKINNQNADVEGRIVIQ